MYNNLFQVFKDFQKCFFNFKNLKKLFSFKIYNIIHKNNFILTVWHILKLFKYFFKCTIISFLKSECRFFGWWIFWGEYFDFQKKWLTNKLKTLKVFTLIEKLTWFRYNCMHIFSNGAEIFTWDLVLFKKPVFRTQWINEL